MSVSPIYIKSQNGSLDLKKIADYSPYEFTIYPISDTSAPDKTNFPGEYDRAITVNKIDITKRGFNGISDVTFNNLIRIYEDGKVEQNISNSWTPRVDYFSSSYTGPKVYLNNLYQSIINDIKNNTVDTSKPRRYMLYGPTGEQRSVTNITRQNGYYRFFVTGIGGTDFNEITGMPLNSVDINNNIILLTYVVYKYDGYSHITTELFNKIFSNYENIQNIQNFNLWLYHLSADRESPIFKIEKNQFNYPLIFYARVPGQTAMDEGVSYKLVSNIATPQKGIFHWYYTTMTEYNIPADYQIYRRTGGFLNFDKTNSALLLINFQNIIFNKTISPTNSLNINSSPSIFYITIPNDKPTNRIFVYQKNNDKLLHITDYIPKGTTQKVTINYTNNNGVLNVTSSVVPVNPLPVPQFIRDGNDSYFVGGERKGIVFDNKCDTNSIIYNIQGYTTDPPIKSIFFTCKNIYNKQISDGGGWFNNKWDGGKFQMTEEGGYNRLYANANSTSNVDYLKFFSNNGKEYASGVFAGGEREIFDHTCPNGKLAGLYRREDFNALNGIQAYCASPTIPKDYSDAITWSKNPINPIAGGNEGNTKTYVCRTEWNGYMVPGKFIPNHNKCYYNVPNRGWTYSENYQLADAISNLTWKSKSDASVKKIEGGINPEDGTVSYICRVKVNNDYAPGNEVNNKCYYQYNGANNSDTYELLSRQ